MAVYTPWAAGQKLTAADLNSKLVQETMPWTALASVGSYASGFSAGGPAPRMHKVIELGVEVWEFEGRINIASLAANSDTTIFTFSAGFRVASERGFTLVGSQTNFYDVRCTFQTSGQLHIGIPAAGPATTSGVLLDGIRITNPLV